MRNHPFVRVLMFGVLVGPLAIAGCGKDSNTSAVTGRIFVDSNENGIFDNGESPMADVKVVLTLNSEADAETDADDGNGLVTTTNANGVYAFSIEQSGSYSLTQDLQIGTRNLSNATEYGDIGELGDFGSQSQAIVGGQNASPGEYPFMTGLIREFRGLFFPFCGSALISDKYVLTAGHCVDGEDPEDFSVSIGGLRGDSGTLHAVKSVITHPGFNIRRLFQGYDIALVELEDRVDLENSDIYTLATATQNDAALLADGNLATVIGWGSMAEGQSSAADIPLQEAHLPLVGHNECQGTYPGLGGSDLLVCAGNENGGVDSCQGDSGGPLLVWNDQDSQWMHGGVVSAGEGCARPGTPGVYSKTSGYQEWLEQVIDETSSPSIEMTLVGGDEARVHFANKMTMRPFVGEAEERINP